MHLSRRNMLRIGAAQGVMMVAGVRLALADPGVGAIAALENDAWGTRVGAARASLSMAASVYRNQKLETGEDSATTVKFADQSELSLGANANMTIDDYVFAGASSRSSMMLAKGAFRFLSGQMPEKNMQINTPTVGIGIRGTELVIDVYEDGSTELSTISGAAEVVSNVTREVLSVLAGQSVLADAEGVFIGGVRDFVHRKAEDLIQREIDKLKSKSPIPLPDIPNPFR